MPAQWLSQRQFAEAEGCDEKQVRRGVASGKLVARADGKLDSGQVGSGWRRPRVDSKPVPAGSETTAAPAAAPPAPAAPPTTQVPPADAPELNSYASARLKEGIARKEDFKGRREELNYLKDAGLLVELDLARKIFFDEARVGRDAWMNFPDNYSAQIAADLGIEADRLREVLKKYVHKQLARLGEPRDQFVPA